VTKKSGKDREKSFSLSKTIIFSLLPLVALVFFAEITGRIIYYQLYGKHKFVLAGAFYRSQKKVEMVEIEKITEATPKSFRRKAIGGFYKEEGREVLAKFEELYAKSFIQLVEEADRLGSKLIFIYIPTEYVEESPRREICRTFYRELAQKHRVDFLDLTEDFLKDPAETVTLLPFNGHLSRYGNKIVARELAKYIEANSRYRMRTVFADRPAILGDLAPNENKIWDFAPSMPYRVVSNSQGLRMSHDLKFPKEKQRILCLGDSFTFGPYMANHDTFPELLGQKFPDKEVINAGICGWTITDEVSLFRERAKYCEPDIIILQALDNDLSDFFYFYRQQFAREKGDFKPSPVEAKYFKRLEEVAGGANQK
jgi:lysophospholipase L1-like esterase